MASTVEQCETKPLGPLSSTLEMFDTFKSQEEDKDSDEESFHLPLLGCDDDAEHGKDDLLSTPNPETEDDILNKFETPSTPEGVDEKMEENVLLTEDNETSVQKDECSTKENECEINTNDTQHDQNKIDTQHNQNKNDTNHDQNNKESDSETDGLFNDLEIIDEADGSFEEVNSDNPKTEIVQNELSKIKQEEESMKTELQEDENAITDSKQLSNDEPQRDNKEPVEIDLKDNEDFEESETDEIWKNDNFDELLNKAISNVDENMETEETTEKDDDYKEVTSDRAKDPNETVEDKEIISPDAETAQDHSETIEDDNENDDINEIAQEVTEKLSNEEIDPLDALDDDIVCSELEKNNLKDEENNKESILNEEKVSDNSSLNEELENNSKVQTKNDEVELMEVEESPVSQETLTDDNLELTSRGNTTQEDHLPETEKAEQDENEQICDTAIDNECTAMDVDPLDQILLEDELEDVTTTNKEDKPDDKNNTEKEKVEDEKLIEEEKIEDEKLIEEEKIEDEKLIEEEKIEDEKLIEEEKVEDEKLIGKEKIEDQILIEEDKIEDEKSIGKEKIEDEKLLEEEKTEDEELVEDKIEDEKLNDEENIEDEKLIEEKKVEDKKLIEKNKPEETEDSTEKIKMDTEDCYGKSNAKDNYENKEVTEIESKETQAGKDIGCDDLLDISVIRDADEDNASAIAEIAESHSSEKSENDEQDDKQENDLDEIEADQEDNLLSSDKEEQMEYDDGNTNSCDQDISATDNVISELTSDAEIKDSDITQSESESQHPPSVDDITEISSNQSSVDTNSKNGEQSSGKASVTDETSMSNTELESTKPPSNTVEAKENDASAPTIKRPLSEGDKEELPVAHKKMRMSEELDKENKKSSEGKRKPGEEKKKLSEEKRRSLEAKKKSIEEKKKLMEERKKSNLVKSDKIKTLVTFEKFMKNRNLGDGKLTRSDLEQFCLQKICEALVHKTETGELHQTIKKQEQVIDSLRKDLQQLSKQTRDLDIVNKKLMNELRAQNGSQKPLVPLKITRSVGLQVKLNLGAEPVIRRKSYTTTTTPTTSTTSTSTPRTPTTPNNNPTAVVNRARSIQPNINVVRQIAPATPTTATPRKTPAVAPILTQALQTRPAPPLAAVTPPTTTTKRPATIRVKTTEAQKPSAPGVIDLTDEDDRTNQAAKTVVNNVQPKVIPNKSMGASSMKILNKNINMAQNKNLSAKGNNQKANNAQQKTVAVGQVKTSQVGTKVNMQARAVTTIPQGVRLASAQMKNGIAIPTSVVTSSAGGTTQLMYVVPSGSSGAGVQKAMLFNFQPTNGVLTSALNGSSVSVIPSKANNTMQIKTISPRKHPAALPLPPSALVNTSLKPLLPKPHLSIRKTDTGIILQWRMPYNLDVYEGIASYQLFAYQETNAPPSTDMWRKVGDVKALALPMACTLTQFADKNKYYFAVRSVDVHKRIGAFSDPEEISL